MNLSEPSRPDPPKELTRARAAVGALLARYPGWVARRHRAIIAVALLLAGAGVSSRIPLRTDFAWLLPDGQPSVLALRELTARRPSSAVIEIGVASPSPEASRRFAADLASALRRRFPPELLSEVDDDDGDIRSFVWRHRHLYAQRADLAAASESLRSRVGRAGPFDLGLDEPAEADADRRSLELLRGRLAQARSAAERPPGYVGEHGRLRMLVLRCRFGDTEPEKGARALSLLRAIVADLGPTRYHPELEVGYCGDPVSAAREHELVLRDVVASTALCLLLVAGVLLLYFRAPRAVLALCLTLAAACCVTFGFTRLCVGHLNSSTAFLGSVVAGNGINFGIIVMARYLEERRRRGASHEQALSTALRRTAVPTLVAGAAAGSAYLSLTTTTFRGFSELGIIAGSGMAFCWIAAVTLLPALLTLLDRRAPLVRPRAAAEPLAAQQWSPPRGRPTLVAAAAVLAVASGLAVLGASRLWANPFEDDLHALRSRSYPTSATGRFSARLDAAFGRDQSGGFYVGVERPDDAVAVAQALRDVERDVPPGRRQIGTIDALDEVLPGGAIEQLAKIDLLTEIGRLCERIGERLAPGSEDASLLAELRPPPAADLRAIGFDDLPLRLQRAFTERDGRRGLLLAVHPGPGFDGGSYSGLRRAVGALRAIQLTPRVQASAQISGSEILFVEMMNAVETQGPRAALLSLALVLGLLVLALGPRGGLLHATFALAVGLLGMFGLMSLFGVRLNFLNYIAVPITIGIGVDYPFQVVARLRQEGWVASAGVRRTAGAVALCSATTTVGYAVLLLADTGAIRSFGAAAVLGELSAIGAALVVVPALVVVVRLGRGGDPAREAAAPRRVEGAPLIVEELAPSGHAAWDAYVDAHPLGNCYHLTAWAAVAARAYGHRTPFLVVRDQLGGPLRGALPLFVIASPVSRYVTTAMFGGYGALLADSAAARGALLEGAIALTHRVRGSRLVIKTIDEPDPLDGFERQDAGGVARLSLEGGAGEIWRRFRDKMRNSVRKAERSALELRTGPAQLPHFYDVLAQSYHRKGVPIYGAAVMRALCAGLGERAEIVTLWRRGRAISGALVIHYKDVVYVPFCSSRAEELHLNPNNLIYWHIIRRAAARGMRTLDFGRSPVGSGAMAFKLGWGAALTPQPHFVHPARGRRQGVRADGPWARRAIRLWQRLPRAVVDRLGPWVHGRFFV